MICLQVRVNMSKNWDLEQEIFTYLDNLQGKINEVKQLREKAFKGEL